MHQLLSATARLGFVVTACSLLNATGCVSRPENEVVLYCALDQEFAQPILGAFERANENSIETAARFDVESTKTVGLVNRLMAEAGRPQADLFWNNEILHTIRLQKAGLLKTNAFSIPSDWPTSMKSSDGSWCGFAARARILLVNREKLPDKSAWPTSVRELADPKWKGQCGVARPLFGTTATHFVAIDQLLGADAADKFFQQVSENAVVLAGNKQVAQAVSSGQLAWGVTDTDDAVVELDHSLPVEVVWPDQQTAELGTLRIPNTIAVIKGGPHPKAAVRLAEYLISPITEERLAMGDSAQLPVGPAVEFQPRVAPPENLRWMPVDFEAAADRWDSLNKRLAELFP